MVYSASFFASLFFLLLSLSACTESGLKMSETSSESESADESTSAEEEGAPATEPLPTPTEDDATVPVETGETTGTVEEAGAAVATEEIPAEATAGTDTTTAAEGATTEGGGSDEVASETCADLPLTAAPKIPPPHLKRTGTNIVSDPTITSSSSWYLDGSSVYDADVSRTSGSGSIKFPGTFDSAVKQLVYLKKIAITPGKTYIFSAYMKSSTWPPGLMSIMPGFRDASINFLINGPDARWANTGADEWQEIVTYVKTHPSAAYVELFFYRNMSPRNDGDIWIDDVYIGEIDERIQFDQPPSKKTPFAGSQTKVDALGNVEVLRNGAWEPFFPLCMYTDSNRPDYKLISEQGFNCNMRMNDATYIERSKNATSAFNPDGMLATLDITAYILQSSSSYTLESLSDRLDTINSKGLGSYLLMYYWDNEFVYDWDQTDSYDGWALQQSVTDKVKEKDLDADGNRQRPIYALQGLYGVARMYRNDNVQMTDVVGEYASMNANEEYSDVGGIDILNNIEDQTNPLVFVQINLNDADEQFRPLLYWAIARGAKGMGFWRDYYPPTSASASYYQQYGSIDQQAWWSNFPNIRREIDQMLPLIRRPHWTSWKAISSNSSVKLGTRDYKDEGYIIAANMSDSESTATITLSNLYYTPASVKNFFTGEAAVTLADSQFTVTLSGFGTAVYRLEQAPQKPASCGEGQ